MKIYFDKDNGDIVTEEIIQSWYDETDKELTIDEMFFGMDSTLEYMVEIYDGKH